MHVVARRRLGRTSGRLLLALLASLGAVGCDGGESEDGDGGGEPAASASTTTTTATITTTTTSSADAAPAELRGRWRTTLAGGDEVTFTVQPATYQIRRGPGAVGGAVRVQGDTILLTTSVCEGVGEYRWSRQGDQLTLTMVGVDPCANRSEVLVGSVFTAEG